MLVFVQTAVAAAAAPKESVWAPKLGHFLVQMSLMKPAVQKNWVRKPYFSLQLMI